MARVVVVGGGLGGCACAARLAKLGHEVALVEALPHLGGAVGTVTAGGYGWDAGPAATALPAVLRDLFRKSGRPLDKELALVPVESLREHRFPDGSRLRLPSGSRGVQHDAVGTAMGRAAADQWADYVHDFVGSWDLLRRDFFERPYTAHLASQETRALLETRLSLARAAAARLADRRLRSVAVHHAVSGGHDPRRVPAWWGLLDYLEQNFGSWTVPGGFGALAAALDRRLGTRRVQVLTGVRVHDLDLTAKGARGVVTDAGPLAADLVVVAADPRRLPALADHVRAVRPAAPPMVVHLGLSDAGGLPADPGLAPETVFHGDGMLVLRTGGTAPAGRRAWTLLARGRPSEDPVQALARCGLDVRDAVEVRVDRTPEQIVERYGGSPYGFAWRGRRTLRRRLDAATPLPGVFAAGAHTGGGGWLPFVGLSAAVAADHIGPA